MFDPVKLLRPHLQTLVPYSSARDEYQGAEGVFLDANENPIGSITERKWNRYPDPYQADLKAKIGEVKKVPVANIFLGNGSDEPIDLLFRAFCEPGKDEVIINPPTYGMYKVSADINNVAVKEVLLTNKYDLDVEAIKAAITKTTKLIFVCSPNNPTGNDVSAEKIEELLCSFAGIVVVDEAYIDFTARESLSQKLGQYPNLVVLQTFSKAWGLASLRLGMAYASEALVEILNKIKPPYNISGLTQETVLNGLENVAIKDQMVAEILENRAELKEGLEALSMVKKIHPSDANFFLVEVENGHELYNQLISKMVIVRDRSRVVLCDNGLRITVGSKYENFRLIQTIKELTEK
ncbi:MAG: histidinol-phosphate transaminase [Roseivirga sp.]|nr:histidinol-phosphate transaminase [Roseivirga sp.]